MHMDASNPTALAKAVIPRLPMILRTAVLHPLGCSPMSSVWDLRTELTVNIIRSFVKLDKPIAVSKIQQISKRAPPIKGNIHVSKITLPRPDDSNILERMCEGIDSLNYDGGTYTRPSLEAVEAEWTGYRGGVDPNAPRLDVSEEVHYANIMEEVKSDITILYFHGGAYYMMDPATHRQTVVRLAQLTGGRCLSIRYRLSPKYPFPAQLLDALISYLSLLYPPKGALHCAVPPTKIAFAGDSAGGHLALCLTQLLLTLQRLSPSDKFPKVIWYGKEVDVPLPMCVAPNSGWMDPSLSLPSVENNAKFEYLPPPSQYKPQHIECPIWPAESPRHHFFTDDSMMFHPFVGLLFADWTGAPPMWITTGEELLADEIKFLAKSAVEAGVKVKFEEYEAMPHCFAMMLEALPASKVCYENWANFIKMAIESPEDIKTGGKVYEAKTLRERHVDIADISTLTQADVRHLVNEKLDKRKDVTPPTRSINYTLADAKARL